MSEIKAHALSSAEVLRSLHSSLEGLLETEAQERLKKVGLNKLTPKKKISAVNIFINQFKNTLTLILIASTFLILFIYFFGGRDQSDLIEAGLILTIILIITILGFVQEYKAEKAIEHLKQILAFTTKVIRAGIEKEIDVSFLVPGDIVILEEGTKVPADIRLINAFNLTVSEAPLTGESTPVSKKADPVPEETQINDQTNMVFAGTTITAGRGTGVVVKTGDQTEIGKIAQLVSETEEDRTPIQLKLDQVSKILSWGILGICAIVFIFIVFFASSVNHLPLIQRVVHSFIAAVALAVAAIPEGLPAVVTISLALGTQRMLRRNALIRKLNSVETLGSTDVICSDKTGTLTKGEMTVRKLYFQRQTIDLSGIGYEREGEFTQNGEKIDPTGLRLLLEAGWECNNAIFTPENKPLGDPTEVALLISAMKGGLMVHKKRLYEVPFSSERKMMSVVVQDQDNYLVFTKGAPEVVLEYCRQVYAQTGPQPLDNQSRSEILDKTQQFSSQALRTLGFAYKYIPPDQWSQIKDDPKVIESDLIFLGLQGMIDPPRVEVRPLIEQCHQSGIRVIMITGDHAETAKAVAHEIGISGEVITGQQLVKMSEDEFEQTIKTINIYARVDPSFKLRIVNVLKKDGHIVAMTGDGVNDAPALKKADIGVAMGITGTDVAKEAADMVLLDDKFSTIVYAIEEGRGIFHNIRKFVNFLLACNIGEVMVVFIGVILFHEVPLTATMLLWINVVTDGLPAVALGLDQPEKGILKYPPQLFQSEIIEKKLWLQMILFGFFITMGTLGIYILNLHEGVVEAKGAAFTAITLFEIVYLFILRSSYKLNFLSNPWLLAAITSSILLQLVIIYVPFMAQIFEVKHIDFIDWAYILLATTIIWVITKSLQKLIEKMPPSPSSNLSLAKAQS